VVLVLRVVWGDLMKCEDCEGPCSKAGVKEKHVHPGPASLNPVVIDDSYLSAKGPKTSPQQHCNHERKCYLWCGYDPMFCDAIGCEEDTRSRPAPSHPTYYTPEMVENRVRHATAKARDQTLYEVYLHFVDWHMNPEKYNKCNPKECYKYLESLRRAHKEQSP